MKTQYDDLTGAEHAQRAMNLALVAHAGQVNEKNGEPYFRHPERVAAYVHVVAEEEGLPSEWLDYVVAVAWLHDILEDTAVELSWLIKLGFPIEIFQAVLLLTRDPSVPPHLYYSRINNDDIARVVKLADLRDNTDPERMSALDPQTQVRLAVKYVKAYKGLEAQPPPHIVELAASVP